MRIDVGVKLLEGLVVFFKNYRNKGLESALNSAKELAMDMWIEPEFLKKRQGTRKRQFDEIANTDREPQTQEERYRTYYLYVVVDIASSELSSRFDQLNYFEKIFEFLFDGVRLKSVGKSDMENYGEKLESELKRDNVYDVDSHDLFLKVRLLQDSLPEEAYGPSKPWKTIQILEFVVEMSIFRNVLIAYQILLTLPVTVASAERSFSKLKLLKSTTISQERLNGLTILCIEKNMLENISYDDIIENFASQNARRMHLI